MSNVFRKLIQKEFGIENYCNYFFQYQEIIYGSHADELSQPKKLEVYNHMYNEVLRKDKKSLMVMKRRVEDTVGMAFGIKKYFVFTIVTYLLSLLILFCVDITPFLVTAGVLGVSFCFLIKLFEFIGNRYCFIDANLFRIYTEVLAKVLTEQDKVYKES